MLRPDWRSPLALAHDAAIAWLEGLADGPVRPDLGYAEMKARFDGPVPEHGEPADDVVSHLASVGPAGLMAMNHARFFGWVIGGSMPAGVAADWLVAAWDQNTAIGEPTPTAAAIEAITARWILDLLDLPRSSSVGFVTGGQVANLVCLAAARDRVLRQVGWDVARQGLLSAPPINLIVGEYVHHTVGKALRILGLGDATSILVPTDNNARIIPEALAKILSGLKGPTIVCAQAGEVNTGGIDRFGPIADVVDTYRKQHPIWLHIDGAIGLLARVSPTLAPRLAGVERADSWSTDAHKWLNTPYDCGVAIVSDPESHHRAMGLRADYLPVGDGVRNPVDWNPELSRRARAVPVYATIRNLGRSGIAEMIDRDCAMARRIASGLAQLDGAIVLNEVELNQVLVRFTDPDGIDDDWHTETVLARVQQSGTAYPSTTTWQGRAAIRISVCNWSIEASDADLTVEALATAHRG
jgi:glutamate/tyrosine decarboxylase-like PLP-dependent enzyme